MRAAGAVVAHFLESRADGPLVAFAGPGNNGGDAYAAFAVMPSVRERIIYGDEMHAGSAARADAIERARANGVIFRPMPAREEDARGAVNGAAWCVDALFGTGARTPVDQRFAAAARVLDARERSVLAIDMPSPGVRATATIALGAMKSELLLERRADAGELWIGDIGITPEILLDCARTFAALDDAAFLDLLPKRARESDKRQSGAPLIVAGSSQFPGAAVLCALGAARSGAGYVTVATSSAAAPAIRAHLIEQVVVTYDTNGDPGDTARDLLDVAKKNTSAAIGPGLGMDDWTGEMVRALISGSQLPMVIDASGLYHLSKHLDILRGKDCVVTPHAGEFARLSGKGTVAPGTRVERIREFVSRTGITTLLKGEETLIDDGRIVHINTTGTNALATAGTGDVLTGIVATLLSQQLSVADAACAGAYWHGLAGRCAQRERPVGVIARDVAEHLAAALPPRPAPAALLRYV
jgi:NAD(P)H-hydrate epimerase